MKHFVLTMVMAARNLLRNRRRTVSTLLAIAVGLVGLTFLDGYITYSMRGLQGGSDPQRDGPHPGRPLAGLFRRGRRRSHPLHASRREEARGASCAPFPK